MAQFWESAPLAAPAKVEPESTLAPLPAPRSEFWAAAPLARGGPVAGVDVLTGANPQVRVDVGSAPTVEDRLATLRRYYPDAQPYGKDNYVFTHPATKRQTLYNEDNPKVMGVPLPTPGDVAEHSRTIAQGVGGTLGGIAGTFVAPGPGTAVGAGAGAAGTGLLFDVLRELRGNPDSRSGARRSLDTAGEFAGNAVGQKVGDLIAPAVGRMISGKNATAGTTPEETAGAFKAVGAQPTAGQVTGNRVLQGVEQAASKLPTGATTMQKTIQQELDDVGDFLSNVRANYGSSDSTTEAGRVLQKGGEGFIDRFKSRAGQMFDTLDQHVPGDAPISVANTLQSLGGSIDKFTGAESIGKAVQNPKLTGYLKALLEDVAVASGMTIQSLDDAIASGQLPYRAIKEFRTKIGQQLADRVAVSDVPRAELQALYGGLTNDMRAAAQAAGPEARTAFERANKFYAAGMKRIDDFVGDLVTRGTPEEAYKYAMGQAKDGATRLYALRRSMDPDQWGVLSSEVLRKMGEPNPGQAGVEAAFSPAKFLTEWVKLRESGAADALFRGTHFAGLPEKLDALAKVSGAIKDTAAMANPSGTASSNFYINLLTGGVLGAGGASLAGQDPQLGAVVGAVGPYAAAKLMTSPMFIDWLVKASKGGSGPSATAVLPNLTRLVASAETSDPQVRDAVHRYARAALSAVQAGNRASPPAEAAAPTTLAAP